MTRAVIFDCFGVLTADGWGEFSRIHLAGKPAALARAEELRHMADARLLSHWEFVAEIADLTGVSRGAVEEMLLSAAPNRALLDYIRTVLKPTYKIGLLSNVSVGWLENFLTPEELSLFDARALSHESGFSKPHPRAYEIAADRLGVSPDECVFFDDQERNITAAREQGMQAYIYQTFDDVLAVLDPPPQKG